jgi:hypothetical protein
MVHRRNLPTAPPRIGYAQPPSAAPDRRQALRRSDRTLNLAARQSLEMAEDRAVTPIPALPHSSVPREIAIDASVLVRVHSKSRRR